MGVSAAQVLILFFVFIFWLFVFMKNSFVTNDVCVCVCVFLFFNGVNAGGFILCWTVLSNSSTTAQSYSSVLLR